MWRWSVWFKEGRIINFPVSPQRIRDHITEPGMTLPDDEFSEYLVKLLCISQATKSSLTTVAAINPTTNCNRCSQLQEKIRKGSTRIGSSTSRLFQVGCINISDLLPIGLFYLWVLVKSIKKCKFILCCLDEFKIWKRCFLEVQYI